MLPKILLLLGTISIGVGAALIIANNFNLLNQATNQSQLVAEVPTIETFKRTYPQIMPYYSKVIDGEAPYPYGKPHPTNSMRGIQQFSFGTVIHEFSQVDSRFPAQWPLYGGHIDSYEAPPYFSYDFSMSIFTVHRDYPTQPGYELPIDPKNVTWYPSKIVSDFDYTGGEGSHFRIVKSGLPAERGFALKVTYTNKRANEQPQSIGFYTELPSFGKLVSWPEDQAGWNFLDDGQLQSQASKNITASYDASDNTYIFENDQGAYMAVGFSQNGGSYLLGPSIQSNAAAYQASGGRFTNSGGGPNTHALGYLVPVYDPSTGGIEPGGSRTVTAVVGIGGSVAEAKAIVNKYKNQDTEAVADQYWNMRLAEMNSNIPQLQTGDMTLNQLYLNSTLEHLVNRWDTLRANNNTPGFIGEVAGSGHAPSKYYWMTGTANFNAVASPRLWRAVLMDLLSMDATKCRAYESMFGRHLCDIGYQQQIGLYADTGYSYAYNEFSVIDAVYQYITTSNDWKMLSEQVPNTNQTVWQRLKFFMDVYESKVVQEQARSEGIYDHLTALVNMGHDRNLYEFDRNAACGITLGGKYNGIVISPNAERAVAFEQLADMARKTGSADAASYQTYAIRRANSIKTLTEELWDPKANWYKSIALYDKDKTPRATPYENSLLTIAPFLLLQYDDLLPDHRREAILSRLNEFKGPYGFRSVGEADLVKSEFCPTDWHGLGLYNGAVGAVLTGMFKNDRADEAYDMLSPTDGRGYAYMKDMPYYSQAYLSDQPGGDVNYANIEGVSIAQAIMRGMFGFNTNIDHTSFSPKIPARLLENSPNGVSLLGIKSQSHIFNITVIKNDTQALQMRVGTENSLPADHARFGYQMTGKLNLALSHMEPNTKYYILAKPLEQRGRVSRAASDADESGNVIFNLELNGNYLIYVDQHEPIGNEDDSGAEASIILPPVSTANPDNPTGQISAASCEVIEGQAQDAQSIGQSQTVEFWMFYGSCPFAPANTDCNPGRRNPKYFDTHTFGGIKLGESKTDTNGNFKFFPTKELEVNGVYPEGWYNYNELLSSRYLAEDVFWNQGPRNISAFVIDVDSNNQRVDNGYNTYIGTTNLTCQVYDDSLNALPSPDGEGRRTGIQMGSFNPF